MEAETVTTAFAVKLKRVTVLESICLRGAAAKWCY